MDYKIIKRSFALLVFLTAGITYYLTVQPSVSFWDCGEYLATGYGLEIPHPPGAPLFLILSRVFSMLPIAESIAFRMNLISVITSASAVLLIYLVIIKVIENFRSKNYTNFSEAFIVYATAAIGALAHAFAMITWWNAVETEVYATNTFVFASIVYLLLIWNERADMVENEKLILLIAYLVGLSTSLRLMGALTTLSIVMLIMFRKYVSDEKELKRTLKYFLIHAGILLLLAAILWASQSLQQAPTQEEYKSFDTKFFAFMLVTSIIFIGGTWKQIGNRNSIYLILAVGSFILVIIYPGIVRYLPNLIAKIVGPNNILAAIVILILLAALFYAVHYSSKKGKATINLLLKSFLFVLLGFTSYGVIIIRANLNPPINENAPNNFNELVTYLNREQYGEWPSFQRRYSMEPHQQEIYTKYSSDMDFLWSYQMNHMMTRYILWNFAGRESWDQDSGPNVAPFNGVANFIGKLFNLHFDGDTSRSYFGIPFLIGLIGIYFHFKKDWKMASVFLVLFLMVTYVTAYYQNQQEPQPRERIKFYGTMCFIFSMWISIGIYNIIELLRLKLKNKSISKFIPVIILPIAFIFIPVRMFESNYHEQDRSKNWMPWDFAYNILQSCPPNAVLFTNADNDTFPLWYLQEVEGIRQDVRVACLSLINTPWYIKQLKYEEPHGAKKVDMDLSDDEINNISLVRWESTNIVIPVPKEAYEEFEITDTSITNSGKIEFRMDPTLSYGDVKAIRPQDLAVMSIVKSFNWKRPVCFVLGGSDSFIDLDPYLRLEGLTYRLVPYRNNSRSEFINDSILWKNLVKENPSFSKKYQSGFKYRGLNDASIYFDDNHRNMMRNYTSLFLRLALKFVNNKQNNKAIEVIDFLKRKIPFDASNTDYRILFDIAKIYFSAGNMNEYKKLVKEIEPKALKSIELSPIDVNSYYNPYAILLQIYDNLQEYGKAIGVLQKLLRYYPDDPSIKQMIIRYDSLKASMNR